MNVRDNSAPVDAALFRRVMSRFATGVTVITADVGGAVRGMTANSFLSGSLAPPLCLVSVAVGARMHEHLLAADRFGISILTKGQEAISLHFAGRGHEDLEVEFEYAQTVPLLKNSSAVIAAATEARHDCGDHTLFVGRILHLRDNATAPLVFCGGRYGAFVPSAPLTGEPIIDFW